MAESDQSVPGIDESGSTKELLRVSIPLILSAGSQSVMNAVDRMVLAGSSDAALAAVTPASMLHWTVVCIPVGIILYANTFISQYDGAGKPVRMMASFWQAIWLSAATSLIILGLIPFSRGALSMTGQSPEIAELQAQYFNTLAAGCPLLLLSTALSCFFNGRRRTSVAMYVSFVGVFINFGADYLLVFGNNMIPALGIRGAALATLLARCVEVCVYLYLMLREASRENLPLRSTWRINRNLLRKYFRYGVPSGLYYFVDYAGFTVFLLMIGNLSSTDLAATNLAFSVNGLIFVPLLGFGTAIQTLVGHHLGARKLAAAESTTRSALLIGIGWTGSTAILLFLWPELCLRPFFLFADKASGRAEELSILAGTASRLLQFVAVYSTFDALAVVFASALRGAGDTVYPMIVTLLSGWLIMVLPATLMIRAETATITSLWVGCTAHITLTGLLMGLRFRSGVWKQFQLARSEHLNEIGDQR